MTGSELRTRVADLERRERERRMQSERAITWSLAGLVLLLYWKVRQ